MHPVHATPADEPADGLAQARAIRWAHAGQVVLTAASYSIAAERGAELVLTNRFAEPVALEISALDQAGLQYPVDSLDLDPREVRRINLAQALADAPRRFHRASLRVSFWGDQEMVQAWIIHSRGDRLVEAPLTATGARLQPLVSFWDARPWVLRGGAEARFLLHNTSSTPIEARLWMEAAGTETAPQIRRRLVLPPRGSRSVRRPARGAFAAGTLTITHDGEPGTLIVDGFLTDSHLDTPLPVVSRADALVEGRWEAASIPVRDATGGDLVLTLADARLDGEDSRTTISLRDAATSRALREIELLQEPGQVRSLVLELPATPDAIRLSIDAEDGGAIPQAALVTLGGAVREITLVPSSSVHDGGTYPIPALETHAVTATFLNLGTGPAHVLGHLVWDGGKWALRETVVPAGGAVEISLDGLARSRSRDVLGREIDPALQEGFFQWTSRRGSRELVARLEVQRRGDSDLIGFDCFGCCEEFPRGELSPGSIDFDIGQSATLEALEWIDTCAGTIGPYLVSGSTTLSYASPVSWDGQLASSTGLTRQTVSFADQGYYAWFDCTTKLRTFGDSGQVMVDSCQALHNPDHVPGTSCAQQQTTCADCYSCCEREQDVGDCRCGTKAGCKEGIEAACGTCKQNCFGHFNFDCQTQETTCQ